MLKVTLIVLAVLALALSACGGGQSCTDKLASAARAYGDRIVHQVVPGNDPALGRVAEKDVEQVRSDAVSVYLMEHARDCN